MIRRRRQGVAAIEFALTLPVPVLLLGAVLELGSFISYRESAACAVHDAARLAAALPQTDDDAPTADIEEKAIEKATSMLATSGLTCEAGCTIRTQVDTSGAAETLTLSVRMDYLPLFSLLPAPESIEVSHTVVLEDQW